ncbi:hypothetical protein Tco_1191309 [Tanacetum coccineum]
MAAFWVLNRQFQQFINSEFSLDYDSQMTNKYFVEYTRIEVKHFRDTLLLHMGNVKKSIAERTRHKRQYDRRVNVRQIHMQKGTVDMGKALDAYIRPIYDEEPMVEVHMAAEGTIFATGQQHTEQSEFNNKGGVDQENEHVKAQIHEKVFATAPLKNKLRKVTGNIVDTKFAKPSILEKPPLQPLRNQSVAR